MTTRYPPSLLRRVGGCWALVVAVFAVGAANASVPASRSSSSLVTADRPLRVASSTTTDDLAAVWTATLARLRPAESAPQIVHGRYPTDALEALLDGRADAALCAREPFESELAAARRAGLGELRFIPIATGSRANRGGTHAIAIFVHRSNPLRELSIAQLREVLAVDGRARTWGDLGVSGALAERKIVVHGQPVRRASGNPPGIVNFLAARILGGRPWREDLVAHDDQTGGPTALEAIVQTVARDPAAIGWSGFDYRVDGVNTLALRSTRDGPAFVGTAEEIAAQQYPLSRLVYLCLPERATVAARELARCILQPESQAVLTRSASGFMPLAESSRAAALARLASPLVPPLHADYLAADGRIRVVGYNDMREMVAGWTSAFARDHAGFRFELDLPATRAAVDAVASGRAAFGPLGAELSPSQRSRFRELAGVEPLQLRVAHASLDPRALSGPLAIFVHASNPRRGISLPELAELFSGNSSSSGLEPTGLGAETALGIFFRERVLRGAAFATTFKPHAQSVDVVRHVAENPRAIGFAAAMRTQNGVRILALAPAVGQPAVQLNEAALQSNSYPLGRHLWLLLRPSVEPWMREFLQFVLSDEGRRIVDEGSLGYRALSVEDCEVERAKLQ